MEQLSTRRSYDLNSSLTIDKASSSLFTLKTMMFVSFIVPFVIAYIWYAWKAINNKKITEEEMKTKDIYIEGEGDRRQASGSH